VGEQRNPIGRSQHLVAAAHPARESARE
jgi:hypothetical protein